MQLYCLMMTPNVLRYAIVSLWLIGFCAASAAPVEGERTEERLAMVQTVQDDVRDTAIYLDKDSLDQRVMAALASVPRHEFVPAAVRDAAYDNRPLPIGHGQTISQPYIVAVMTDLLALKGGDRVLEVGTGSGYQAAILAALVDQVYTIEIIAPLGESAKERLQALGYHNVAVRIGDGYYGWKEHAPFDAIVVTAAASHIPPPLIQQLKPGGRMVIPVGSRFMVQELLLVEKDSSGKTTTKQILPVAFVPLTGGH
jgi:protein-L-isoaspartate(D-aspartate) O-methyltransferase